MIALNKRDQCNQAEPYWFDCISGDYKADIPGEIAEHVSHCAYCQGEIEHLKQALGELDKDVEVNGTRAQEDIATCLKLHFNYIGKEVDCTAIKPFLPLLAMPDFQARIPTPITVHLNHCSQCRKDCNALQELELTDSQLAQLAQVFADKKDFGMDAKKTIEVIDAIATKDSFENAKGIKKSQQIRQVLSSMVHRDNSGVVTVYEMSKDVEEQALRTSDDLYTEWPISVQVVDKNETQGESSVILKPAVASVGLSEKSASRFNPSLIRRAVKPIAAAAIVLIALSFIFNTSSVEAVGLKQIYNALEKIKHLYIARFADQDPEPIQEVWASRPLKITLIKTENQWDLWDLPNRVRKVKQLDSSSHETVPIKENSIIKLSGLPSSFGSLMPFASINDVPSDATWHQISDVNVKGVVPGTNVFELNWIEKSTGEKNEPRKWRCYIDPIKNLPLRIDTYEKPIGEITFVLNSVREINYIEKNDIQAVIQSAFPQ